MKDQRNDLLARALPMLCKLGDYIGNGPIDPDRQRSLGARCDLILDIKAELAKPEWAYDQPGEEWPGDRLKP